MWSAINNADGHGSCRHAGAATDRDDFSGGITLKPGEVIVLPRQFIVWDVVYLEESSVLRMRAGGIPSMISLSGYVSIVTHSAPTSCKLDVSTHGTSRPMIAFFFHSRLMTAGLK